MTETAEMGTILIIWSPVPLRKRPETTTTSMNNLAAPIDVMHKN